MNKEVQYDEERQEFFIDVGDKMPEEVMELLEEIKEKLENKTAR